jgi:hypothetical protein
MAPHKNTPSPHRPHKPDNDKPLQIIIAGVFGGLLGPLLRVALTFTQETASPTHFDILYLIGAFMLAALGASVAWGFKETRRQ